MIMDLKNQHIKDNGCSLLQPLLKFFFYISRGLFYDLYRKQSSWNWLIFLNTNRGSFYLISSHHIASLVKTLYNCRDAKINRV